MSLWTGRASILYPLPSRGCSSSHQKRTKTRHGNILVPTWLICPRVTCSAIRCVRDWWEVLQDFGWELDYPEMEEGLPAWALPWKWCKDISTWKQTEKVEITLKTNVWKRLERSSREDRVKNETVKEIMRHKWLSENRKLQWMDQMLMTEKWKQSKQVMKGELRSSHSARLVTGGPRCFEAKDTIRKVFKRWWGASRKETEIKSR